MSIYLVTGGGGFIGSHIVDELVRRGEQVRVLDNFSTGKRENLAESIDRIELTEGDIRDLEVTRAAASSCDFVIHLAALPSVQRSIDDPVTTNSVNVDGSLNVLVAARDASVKRFVCASSSSVYGDSPTLPKREDMTPNPKSPYAVTKLVLEHYCKVFHAVYGLETVALRYFNIFGPRQDPDSQYSGVIARFAQAALDGAVPTVFGDGGQTRDFTYVANAVDATLRACSAEGAAGRVANVACGERHSVMDLISLLSQSAGRDTKPEFGPSRAGDVRDSLADISAARDLLGYHPFVGLREGLARLMDWAKERS